MKAATQSSQGSLPGSSSNRPKASLFQPDFSTSNQRCLPGPSSNRPKASLSQPDFSGSNQRSQNARQHEAELRAKAIELDRFLTIIKGSCPVEFARDQAIVDCHRRLLIDCGAFDIPNTWFQFKKSIKMEKYQYCFRCGTPLGKMEPVCHRMVEKTMGMVCPWDDYIFVVVHCLWHTPATRLKIIADFRLDQDIDDEEFEVWAGMEEKRCGKFYNCLEVFLWFCRSWSNGARSRR